MAAPGAGTLLGRLWTAVQDEILVTDADAIAPAPAVSRVSGSWRLAKDWRPPAHPASLAMPELWVAAREPAGIEFSWASEKARSVGTVVHRALQRMVESNRQVWHEDDVPGLSPALRSHLRALGVAEPDVESGLQQVLLALRNVLSDPRGQWLLRPHDEARSELRMTAVLDDKTVRVAMDRTFVDAAGVRWIIDFKTGMHQGAGLEAFLDSEQARYSGQLNDYARVLRLAGEVRPIRLALYFPLLQAWREWPVS